MQSNGRQLCEVIDIDRRMKAWCGRGARHAARPECMIHVFSAYHQLHDTHSPTVPHQAAENVLRAVCG